MKRNSLVLFITVILFGQYAAYAQTQPAADADGFIPLFDGRTLNGWHGDPKLWTVKDGAIVGKCDGNIPHNTFLISDEEYSDFVLKVRFKLHNHKGNSGVQFRSEESEEFVVSGYQADIADNKFMGILYGEKTGRGIIAKLSDEVQAALSRAVKKDDWNDYVITAKGDHITQELNGVKTVDINDPQGAKSGILALQLHRGHDMMFSVKDIRIKPLK